MHAFSVVSCFLASKSVFLSLCFSQMCYKHIFPLTVCYYLLMLLRYNPNIKLFLIDCHRVSVVLLFFWVGLVRVGGWGLGGAVSSSITNSSKCNNVLGQKVICLVAPHINMFLSELKQKFAVLKLRLHV